jgi:hypothetical protein
LQELQKKITLLQDEHQQDSAKIVTRLLEPQILSLIDSAIQVTADESEFTAFQTVTAVAGTATTETTTSMTASEKKIMNKIDVQKSKSKELKRDIRELTQTRKKLQQALHKTEEDIQKEWTRVSNGKPLTGQESLQFQLNYYRIYTNQLKLQILSKEQELSLAKTGNSIRSVVPAVAAAAADLEKNLVQVPVRHDQSQNSVAERPNSTVDIVHTGTVVGSSCGATSLSRECTETLQKLQARMDAVTMPSKNPPFSYSNNIFLQSKKNVLVKKHNSACYPFLTLLKRSTMYVSLRMNKTTTSSSVQQQHQQKLLIEPLKDTSVSNTNGKRNDFVLFEHEWYTFLRSRK